MEMGQARFPVSCQTLVLFDPKSIQKRFDEYGALAKSAAEHLEKKMDLPHQASW
jgi:hypothetical protein